MTRNRMFNLVYKAKILGAKINIEAVSTNLQLK